MPGPHLTADQAERFHRADLESEELELIFRHLDECPQCRRQYLAAPADNTAVSQLEAGMLLLAWEGDEHPDAEQIFAFGEGTLNAGEHPGFALHLERCASCRAQVQRIRALHDMLLAQSERVIAPLSRITVQDTSGRVVLEGDRVQLEDARKLPAAASGWIRRLLTEGIIAPAREIEAGLSRLRSAMMPISTTRNARCSLISPVNTALRSSEPELRWTTVPDAEDYSVLVMQIAERNGRPVWKGSMGRRTEGRVPSEAQLEPNRTYVWQVTATIQGLEARSDLAWFALLSADAVAEVEKMERQHSDSALMLLGVCERYGLYDEAETHLRRLMELNA